MQIYTHKPTHTNNTHTHTQAKHINTNTHAQTQTHAQIKYIHKHTHICTNTHTNKNAHANTCINTHKNIHLFIYTFAKDVGIMVGYFYTSRKCIIPTAMLMFTRVRIRSRMNFCRHILSGAAQYSL